MNSILDQILPNDGAAGAGPPVTRQPSQFQQRIYDEVSQTQNSILVEAVAGSGKTTTIVAAVRLAAGSSLFLAFNKSIAEELRSRIGSAGECKTLNALGHREVMKNFPRAKLDADKLKKIAKTIIPGNDFGDWAYAMIRAVGLAKNLAVGITQPATVDDFHDIIDSYLDVPADRINDVARWAWIAFHVSIKDKETFDFDDQLYLPILYNWKFPHFNNVFIDEVQDLSPIQHLILLALMADRLFGVGDRHQSIYAFRGAATDSMDLLQRRFKMIELPLSITYRCPQSVVNLAQRYCPQIKAKEGAKDGQVSHREDSIDPETQLQFLSDPHLYTNQLVLSRTNAPLFKAILRHIRAQSPCRVLSNFLDSFQGFLKSLARGRQIDTMTTLEALRRLDHWYDKEVEAADGRRGKLAYLEDKYETARLILEQYKTVAEAVDCIRRLAVGRTGPTFSTIHKAKGLESDHVYILRPDLMPSPWAQGEDELVQEDNLSYVAITRAIESLTFGVRQR